ncbi:uncharacterized protein LOC135469595 [Liolophura sinensis]|uniref:uncharacterized protein LOC135469595 n=1 Tax=Liolophura sinensis TaxID=3198878 RepID=UPI00315973E8
MATFPSLLLAAVCLVCLAGAHVFTEEERELLKQAKFEELPIELRRALTKNKRATVSRWCCANEQPIHSIQHSKIVPKTIQVTSQVQGGTKHCGFAGWKRCHTYNVKYQNKVTYIISYYEVPDHSHCAKEDIRCCKNAVQISGHCVDLAEAAEMLKNGETVG